MKLDALDHPKTLDFAARLNVTRPTAIGHLELFWHFVAKKTPRGNIGKFPDGAIARAADWAGDPVAFIDALLEAGFIDRCEAHRYLVHDWPEHCPNWVRAQLKKLDLTFLTTEDRTEDGSYDRTEERSLSPSTRARVSKGGEGKGCHAMRSEGTASPQSPVDNSHHPQSNGVAKSEDFSGEGSPPKDPQSRRSRAAPRHLASFEEINEAVSKVLAAGMCAADQTKRIAELTWISEAQAAEAVRQLRDRGRLPSVAA